MNVMRPGLWLLTLSAIVLLVNEAVLPHAVLAQAGALALSVALADDSELATLENIVTGVFTPALAKHSKSF
jgi:membrane protein implicated in regulation of membrane protease activity